MYKHLLGIIVGLYKSGICKFNEFYVKPYKDAQLNEFAKVN